MSRRPRSRKNYLTFGSFITAANEAWGERPAKGLVWLAVNAQLIEFKGPQRFSFFEPEKASASRRVGSCSTRPISKLPTA